MIAERVKKIKPSVTLTIEAKAKELKSKGYDVISFAAGEPDFPTPQYIKDATKEAVDKNYTKYLPVKGAPELINAIIKKYKDEYDANYTQDEVIVSCGAKHSIFNFLMATINPEDEVLIPEPYWVSYPDMVLLLDGKPIIVPTDEDFKLKTKTLEKYITPKSKVLIINSPSNPTGVFYSLEELYDIVSLAIKKNILVLSDEIYEKLIYDGLKPISLAVFKEFKNKVFIVNGVSKTYSMTGYRIGYLIGSSSVVKAMADIQSQSTSNPTSISMYAAFKALSNNQDVESMRIEFERRRNFIVDELNKIDGISCNMPKGAFYVFPNMSDLIKRKKLKGAVEFCEKLLEEKLVAVVPGDAFGRKNYVRLSFATSMENITKGINRIKEFAS
ncbi:MAG: pyridoxal phosphate-dependent aminotransferase [bacterium]|nr:pyridoxal phosphate-dependent aminotransferase [bacterium]